LLLIVAAGYQVCIWINCACYAGRNSLKHKIQPIAKSADIGDAVIQYLLYESGGPSLIMMHATGFLPLDVAPDCAGPRDVFTVITPLLSAIIVTTQSVCISLNNNNGGGGKERDTHRL
jgi:hypothetical protein